MVSKYISTRYTRTGAKLPRPASTVRATRCSSDRWAAAQRRAAGWSAAGQAVSRYASTASRTASLSVWSAVVSLAARMWSRRVSGGKRSSGVELGAAPAQQALQTDAERERTAEYDAPDGHLAAG